MTQIEKSVMVLVNDEYVTNTRRWEDSNGVESDWMGSPEEGRAMKVF